MSLSHTLMQEGFCHKSWHTPEDLDINSSLGCGRVHSSVEVREEDALGAHQPHIGGKKQDDFRRASKVCLDIGPFVERDP
eukprot:3236224-Rhodomonas_salina.1